MTIQELRQLEVLNGKILDMVALTELSLKDNDEVHIEEALSAIKEYVAKSNNIICP